MIVDTSALIAIVLDEPGAGELAAAIADDAHPKIAAPTLVEFFAVADARGKPAQQRRVRALVTALRLEVVDFTAEHAGIAREAYRDFGKGSGHPAQLNLGDCFSYALAAATGEPLLCTGEDFTRTDLRLARNPKREER